MARSLSTQLRRAPTRYEPIARLAVGGMAEVWRAKAVFEDGGDHEVAIKRVLPHMGAQPLFRAMFEDEARLGMLLRHPNIVRVYDARDVGGTFIMVMELVDGDSLKSVLERAHDRAAPMPLAMALHVGRELAAALDYVHTAEDEEGAHMGIVHRDVSPHNLLLGRDGAVKLTDFGLADASVHQNVHGEEMVGGKLGYLAPEIIHQQGVDHRIDLFGMAIVLWEMLAGRRLFQGEDDRQTIQNVAKCEVPSLRRFNDRVPERVDELLRVMLDRDPDRRLPSARRITEALDALLRRIDRDVSYKDVALVVGLHLHQKKREAPREEPSSPEALRLADLFNDELAAFVAGAADTGASALDPNEFSIGVRKRTFRPLDE